jgi:hypothetical protein
MSIEIDFSDFSDEIKRFILDTYLIQPPPDEFVAEPEKIKVYKVDRDSRKIIVPMAAWKHIYESEDDVFPRELDERYFMSNPTTTIVPFTLETDPKHTRDQNIVIDEACEKLNTSHTVLLGLFTGYGKTTVATLLSVELGLKTLILCHIDSVNQRWVKDFSERTNLKVKLVDSGNSLPDGYDVYVMGIQKASNTPPSEFTRIGIGTVVVDEIHICTLTCFTDTLLRIHPIYLIGLSATPERKDGLHVLFDHFFGNENIIVRSETKPFRVIRVKTPFEPIIENTMIQGKPKIKWSVAKSSIESNSQRWELIADICQQNSERCILIISDYKVQSMGIYNVLKTRGESVDVYIGSKKNYDNTTRILVGGLKKCGTGFDDSRFTMLIIASDMTDARQVEGRLRCENGIIYDLVDNHFIYDNHFKKRMEWYLQRGATLEKFKMNSELL